MSFFYIFLLDAPGGWLTSCHGRTRSTIWHSLPSLAHSEPALSRVHLGHRSFLFVVQPGLFPGESLCLWPFKWRSRCRCSCLAATVWGGGGACWDWGAFGPNKGAGEGFFHGTSISRTRRGGWRQGVDGAEAGKNRCHVFCFQALQVSASWAGPEAALTARPPCCLIATVTARESGGFDTPPCLVQGLKDLNLSTYPYLLVLRHRGGMLLALGPAHHRAIFDLLRISCV